ncbi:MAG: methyltransferase domain-containing protein [Myxococcota bacterium]|nr:methyltransferase domain-containing protein [Myxococcota bacterium]
MRRSIAVCVLVVVTLLGGCTSWKRCAYEGSDRDSWQQTSRVVAALAIEPGDRVADLGAGSGYFTVHLARAVGPEGRVYAVDVDADMNDYLKGRLDEEGVGNVEVVLGEYEDPRLPDGQIDLLFTSNTYHHIQERPAYFRRVQADLAPGGRVAVVEFDGTEGLFVKLIGHFTDKQTLLDEMEQAGYRVSRDHGFLERQSFVEFTPTAPPAPPGR